MVFPASRETNENAVKKQAGIGGCPYIWQWIRHMSEVGDSKGSALEQGGKPALKTLQIGLHERPFIPD